MLNVLEMLEEGTTPEESASLEAAAKEKYIEENKNKNRSKLIKLSIMLALLAVVMIFMTIAWFSMNREVGSSGMGVKSATLPFDLKTTGYYGYFDDWLDSGTGKIAVNRAAAPEPPSGTSESITTVDSMTIQWLMTDENNAKNYVTEDTEEDNIGIRPGSFGSLKFSVVPRTQETINISFKLNIVPYRTVYQTDGSGAIILDGNGLPTELAPEKITGNNEAVGYLKNHVLFFKNRTGTEGNYVYSDLIPLDEVVELVYIPSEEEGEDGTYSATLTFDKVGNELQEKEITIYWIWPETLAEAVLPGNQQVSGGKPVCGSDNLEIFNKLKQNPGAYLDGYNNVTDTDGTANENLTQTIIKNHYSKLSLEYNNADQKIGDNVGYFVLQLSALGD